MFLLGGMPALLAVLCSLLGYGIERFGRRRKAATWAAQRRAIFSNWKLFAYLVILLTFMNFASHGTQDMYPTFLQRFWHFDAPKRSMISAIAGVGAIFGEIVFGYYSDRKAGVGRS